MITLFYAAILMLVQLALTWNVILGRWKYNVSLGDGGEKELNARIRAHGNFTETTPYTVFLLYCAELYVYTSFWAHILCSLFFLGRILHAVGIQRKQSVNLFRQLGMGLSLSVMGCVAIWSLIVLTPKIMPS